jgi:hypothetical protein
MALKGNKELAIVSVVALYTIAFFWIAASYFRGQQEFTVSFSSYLSLAGIVWVAIVAFSSVCTAHHKTIYSAIALIPSVVLLLVGRFTLSAFVGALILFLLTLSAQKSIAEELQGHIKIRVRRIFSFGVRMLLFGMLLSFIVFATPGIQTTIASGSIAIPEAYLFSVASPIAGMLNQQPENIVHSIQGYIVSRAAGDGLEVTVLVITVAIIAVRAIVPFIAVPTLAIISALFWVAKKTKIITVTTRDVPVELIEI